MSIRKYGRYWAVWDEGELVVVTLYKRGAQAPAAAAEAAARLPARQRPGRA
jgi:hypothetical protein